MHTHDSKHTMFTTFNGSNPFAASAEPGSIDNLSSFPDKVPLSKSIQFKSSHLPNSSSDNPDTIRYVNTGLSQQTYDKFNTLGSQATFDESISLGLSKDQRWFAQWSKDNLDMKGNEEAGLPYNHEGERIGRMPQSFVEVQEDSKERSKGTKSHSRTLSSPYERKERYKKSLSKSNVSEDFISPRTYSSQGKLIGFQGRKRFGRRRGLYETTSLRKTMDNVNLKSADGSVERLYMTENPAKVTSPTHEELLDQQRKKRKYDEGKSRDSSVEGVRLRMKSRDYDEIAGKSAGRQGRSREPSQIGKSLSKDYNRLEQEIKEKDEKMKQMKKFYEKLYDDHAKLKNEMESMNEEKNYLVDNINFHINQNEVMKEQLTQMEKNYDMIIEQDEQIKQGQFKRDEIINNLEIQISKQKTEVALWKQKFEEQAESYNLKFKRMDRERNEILDRKEKLEKSMEDIVSQTEIHSLDDKIKLMKNLEEKDKKIKSLRRKNEEMAKEIERLKRLQNESLERTNRNDQFMSTMGSNKFDTRRGLGETLSQLKSERDLANDLKRYRAEVKKLRSENEHLKLEARGRQQTPGKYSDMETSLERREGSLERRSRSTRHGSDLGALGKVIKEIMHEAGVENVNDVGKKIKELQEGNKSNAKFVNGVLDLVTKCSPPGFFDGTPTVKQAWKWLKMLLEEYMSMKRKISVGDKDKEIIAEVMDFLVLTESEEVIPRVRHLAAENHQMKGIINTSRIQTHRLEEDSFGQGNGKSEELFRTQGSTPTIGSQTMRDDPYKFQHLKMGSQ